MSNYLSSFPENVLTKAISLSSFQNMLINATQQLLDNILQTIESIFFISKQSTIRQLIHSLFIASEYRYQKVPYYCYILKKVIESHLSENVVDAIKQSLLHSFIQPATIHNPRCFFIRSCMNHNILTAEEIVNSINKFYLTRPSNPDRLIYSFCWFCPEIESINKELFDIIYSTFGRNVVSGMIIPIYVNFFRLFEPLRENNWEVYRTCIQYGFNPDHYAIIICRDEVDILKKEIEKNQIDINGYYAPDFIFDCTHMLGETKPNLIQIASFFGSVRCFDYLISIGADIRQKSDKNKTTLMFAVAGGNIEIIKKLIAIEKEKYHQRIDVNKMIETAARFHQNEIFQFFVDISLKNHSDVKEIYQIAINDCAISNNMSLLIKSLEVGVDVNFSDYSNRTPLLNAARVDNYEIMNLLVNHPEINLNITSTGNTNILDWAITVEDEEAVDLIMKLDEKKFNKNRENKESTSVQLAISRGNPLIFDLLVKGGMVHVNEQLDNKLTPLILATIYESIEIVRYLIKFVKTGSENSVDFVDVNAVDDSGRTALHHAADEGYVQIVNLLVDVPGISLDIEDNELLTPLQLAVNWNQNEVADILRNHGAHLSTNPQATRVVQINEFIQNNYNHECDHCSGNQHHE